MRIQDLTKFPALGADERAKARVYGEVFSRVDWLTRRLAQREGAACLYRQRVDLVGIKIDRIAIFPENNRSASVWRISSPDGLEALAKSHGGGVDVYLLKSSDLYCDVNRQRPGPRDLADFGINLVGAKDFVFGNLFPDDVVLTPGLIDTNALPVTSEAPVLECILIPLEADETSSGVARTSGSGRMIAHTGSEAEQVFATLQQELAETSGLHTVFLRSFDGTTQKTISGRMPSRGNETWYISTKGVGVINLYQDLSPTDFRDKFLALAGDLKAVVQAMPATAEDLRDQQEEVEGFSMSA